MAALAPIIYNAETISARHAPSLNAAFQELYQASGIYPIVQTPDGGARTKAECIALGLDWSLSDHYEDSPKGRAAVDIWNQRAFRNAIGDARFEGILAKWGWRNIQINGAPFPSEPWHFANHDPAPIIPASLHTEPISSTEQEIDMTQLNYLALIDDKGKRIKYGIFGQTIPGGCEITTDVLTAQAYGDLAGTRVYDPENGWPVRVGAPLKDIKQAEWDALIVVSARLAKAYAVANGGVA